MIYTYEMWDRKSPVNGCSAENTGFLDYQDVYFIKRDGMAVQVYFRDGCEKYYPFEAETVEERARLHCEALNNAEIDPILIESEETQNG